MSQNWHPFPRYILRKDLIEKFLKSMSWTGKKAIDFGYGSGDMLCTYRKYGMIVDGFDFSEMAKESARKMIFDSGLDKINLLNSEDEVPKDNYDLVSAYEVLEHISDDISTINKWKSYLRDDGYLIISVPAHMSKWGKIDEWAGHYRRYEKKELIEKLKSCDLEIINFWCYPFPINFILDKLLNSSSERMIKRKSLDNLEDRSKESGVVRETGTIKRILSNKLFFYPFIFLQRCFLNYDLGSGYIVILKKVS